MKNILFVFDVPIIPHNGGVQRITDTLTKNFIAEGHNVTFLARVKTNQEFNDYATKQLYFPKKELNSIENITFYHNLIKELNVNVVINQNGAEEASYLYCNVPKGIKLITVNHTYPMLSYWTQKHAQKNILYDHSLLRILKYTIKSIINPIKCQYAKHKVKTKLNKLYTHILDKSDKMVVLSDKYFDDIKFATDNKCDYSKLTTIPNANTYEIASKEIPTKKKQILYVGRFTIAEKRPDRLLQIWKRVCDKHPDWEMLIVGGQNEQYQNYLNRYIKRHKLPRITIKASSKPLEHYKQSSIFTLVSNYEGFPLVITEAMQNGAVPIVFNSFKASTDMISDNNDGFIITPFDYDEFAGKLSKLMCDDTLREKMAQEGSSAINRYNFENIYPQWKALINKL